MRGVQLPIPIALICKDSTLRRRITNQLEAVGLIERASAASIVIYDAPRGSALTALQHLCLQRCLIVVIAQGSAEYLEDLWDAAPNALIFANDFERDPRNIVGHALAGERLRVTPGVSTLLTPAERAVLRLVAHGQEDKAIAQTLCVGKQRVMNVLANVREKLGCANRTQLTLHYWDMWPMHTHLGKE